MKNFTKKIIYASLLSVLVLPAVSYAQLDAVLRSDLDIQSNNNSSEAVLNTDATADVSINTDASVDVRSDTQVGLDAQSARQENAENYTGINLKVNASGVAIVASSQVQSENDLEVFNSNMSARSNAVAEVKVNSDNEDKTKVEVVYNQKGKFLGLFPVNVKIKAILEARANGQAEIKAKKPWFSFLITGKNFNKSEIESRLQANATIQANARANASAQARAEIAEAIVAELDTYTQAQASLAN